LPINFHYQKTLGSGSYGTVAACDVHMGDPLKVIIKCAVKRIPDVFDDSLVTRRTLREIKLMRHFNHKNIVRLLDVIPILPNGKDLYMITELLTCDLDSLIRSKRDSFLQENTITSFTFQMLKGVQCLHQARVIHRDLKPGNIFINKECGTLKIGDLGLARGFDSFGDSSEAAYLTEYVVTRWYRAPEILTLLRDKGKYDTSIDTWSAGCIIFEMIKMTALFPGKNCLDQLQRIVSCVGPLNEAEKKTITMKTKTCGHKMLENNNANGKHQGIRNWLHPSTLCYDSKNLYADLLTGMLKFDPNRRISVTHALNHAIFAPAVRNEDPKTKYAAYPKVMDFSYDKVFGPNESTSTSTRERKKMHEALRVALTTEANEVRGMLDGVSVHEYQYRTPSATHVTSGRTLGAPNRFETVPSYVKFNNASKDSNSKYRNYIPVQTSSRSYYSSTNKRECGMQNQSQSNRSLHHSLSAVPPPTLPRRTVVGSMSSRSCAQNAGVDRFARETGGYREHEKKQVHDDGPRCTATSSSTTASSCANQHEHHPTPTLTNQRSNQSWRPSYAPHSQHHIGALPAAAAAPGVSSSSQVQRGNSYQPMYLVRSPLDGTVGTGGARAPGATYGRETLHMRSTTATGATTAATGAGIVDNNNPPHPRNNHPQHQHASKVSSLVNSHHGLITHSYCPHPRTSHHSYDSSRRLPTISQSKQSYSYDPRLHTGPSTSGGVSGNSSCSSTYPGRGGNPGCAPSEGGMRPSTSSRGSQGGSSQAPSSKPEEVQPSSHYRRTSVEETLFGTGTQSVRAPLRYDPTNWSPERGEEDALLTYGLHPNKAERFREWSNDSAFPTPTVKKVPPKFASPQKTTKQQVHRLSAREANICDRNMEIHFNGMLKSRSTAFDLDPKAGTIAYRG